MDLLLLVARRLGSMAMLGWEDDLSATLAV